MMRLLGMILPTLLVTACVANDPKAEGEECFGTSQCAPNLFCNTTLDPPVCTQGSTMLPIDAAVQPMIDAPPAADAAPNAPDAPPGAPDAAVVPDAAVPDAAVPDASTIDAMP